MTKLKTEVTFIEKNGRTFSKRIETYENGQVAQIGIYVNSHNDWSWSIPTGAVINYYEDGTLKSEVLYDEHGSLDGDSRYFDVKGRLIKTKSYLQDNLVEEMDFEPVAEES
jgi:antitoxin component YwqK of YwqJK toxin-antitoxin module